MTKLKTKVSTEKSNGIKQYVMRGCDLKGKGAMLALGLTYASNGYKGEITIDADFISALLGEYAEIAVKESNHA